MHGSVTELFSHMKLIGLALIASEYLYNKETAEDDRVLIGWESPDTAVLSTSLKDLPVETVAVCVREYVDNLVESLDTISQTISVAKKEHSPLSPRIAKELTPPEWSLYQSKRTDIVDLIRDDNPIFSMLVNSLGFPAYWSSTLEGQKGKTDLDLGASRWEMAPRNSGSEFIKNKYLALIRACSDASVDEIAGRICGDRFDDQGGERNACGLHAPAHLDVLMSLIALTGIAVFPTMPVTTGKTGSISAGALTVRVNGRKKTYFVLPVTGYPVTLDKYAAICRNAELYQNASQAVGAGSMFLNEVAAGSSGVWLASHGGKHVVTAPRVVAGSPSCPEYYALEGTVTQVGRT